MPKRPRDTNQLAKFIVDLATGEAQEPLDKRSPAAVKRGRAGGLKGGAARMAKLNEAQRVDLAKKAAAKRWKKGRASNKRAARP